MKVSFDNNKVTSYTIDGGMSPEYIETLQTVFGEKEVACRKCGNTSVSISVTLGDSSGPIMVIRCPECNEVETRGKK